MLPPSNANVSVKVTLDLLVSLKATLDLLVSLKVTLDLLAILSASGRSPVPESLQLQFCI